MKIKEKNKIAFDFVLDRLMPLHPVVRPMFGAHAIYVGEKIVLITRNKEAHTEDNGVWLGTTNEHHASLKKEFPSMRSIFLFNDGTAETAWQVIPFDGDDFESEVMHACDLILKHDLRIGKIPKARKPRVNRKSQNAKAFTRSKKY
jgi:hypothetical protein